MATTLSTKKFFERQDVASFREDQPMDAGYVWTLLDNIHHMVDESGKYRLNWLAPTSNINTASSTEQVVPFRAADKVWYTIFPTQWVVDFQYPRYDVRLATYYGGVDEPYTLRISLVTPGTTPPILSGDQQGVIGTETVEITLNDQFVWSDVLFPSKLNSTAPGHIIPAPSYDSSSYSFGPICLIKLMVECLEPASINEGGPFIGGAQVREYLR